MPQLAEKRLENLRCQFGISSQYGGRRYLPYASTEQGVAMLSGVLRSPRAVQVNIEIMRAFVRLRQILASHAELSRRLDELEEKYDRQFQVVFEAIRQLMAAPPEETRRQIGSHVKEDGAVYASSQKPGKAVMSRAATKGKG
jgi:hypothetical protein